MTQNINITTKDDKRTSQKIPSWKSPEPERVQGHSLKKLTALHERIAKQMFDIISSKEVIPKWMALGKTILCQKDPSKGNAADNYEYCASL